MATAIIGQRWAAHFREGRAGVKAGDSVVLLAWRYGAVENAMRHTVERSGGRVVTVALPFPCPSEEAILEALDKTLRRERGRVKFVLLDHISSQPALVLPIHKMVALARGSSSSSGGSGVVEVAVDAAHAVGGIDLHSNPSLPGRGSLVDAIGAGERTATCTSGRARRTPPLSSSPEIPSTRSMAVGATVAVAVARGCSRRRSMWCRAGTSGRGWGRPPSGRARGTQAPSSPSPLRSSSSTSGAVTAIAATVGVCVPTSTTGRSS